MNGLPTVPKELFLGMNAIETQDYSDQISKIFSIYQSNSFDDGVGIQRHGFMKKSWLILVLKTLSCLLSLIKKFARMLESSNY